MGYFSHGKSAIVNGITGFKLLFIKQRFKEIYNLGYANAKLYKCPKYKPPKSYESTLLSYISFVDCPRT